MKNLRYDERISFSFDNLVEIASTSKSLSNVALHGGEHEKEIEKLFHSFLSSQFGMNSVCRQKRIYYGSKYKDHDIVITHETHKDITIEIKSAFTDPGGVASKTGKGKGLEKDMQSLKLALDSGVLVTYELVVLFECFPVDKDGEPSNRPEPRIKWPRMQNYNPIATEKKVNGALDRLSRERGLKIKLIKGWQRVKLPNPRPNIRAFLDCALYKVQLK